jgi:hypothetical protein
MLRVAARWIGLHREGLSGREERLRYPYRTAHFHIMQKLDDGAVFMLHSPDNLPPDPHYADKFYEAIGRFAVTWGSMETDDRGNNPAIRARQHPTQNGSVVRE